MNKNPYLNAVLAGGYIVLIVNAINFIARPDKPDDTLLIPMVMLSLLTLSTAIMGYLFAYRPLQLYLDGAKNEAVVFFFKTVGSFAVITAIFLVLLSIANR